VRTETWELVTDFGQDRWRKLQMPPALGEHGLLHSFSHQRFDGVLNPQLLRQALVSGAQLPYFGRFGWVGRQRGQGFLLSFVERFGGLTKCRVTFTNGNKHSFRSYDTNGRRSAITPATTVSGA
jgi:hypothetical protein